LNNLKNRRFSQIVSASAYVIPYSNDTRDQKKHACDTEKIKRSRHKNAGFALDLW